MHRRNRRRCERQKKLPRGKRQTENIFKSNFAKENFRNFSFPSIVARMSKKLSGKLAKSLVQKFEEDSYEDDFEDFDYADDDDDVSGGKSIKFPFLILLCLGNVGDANGQLELDRRVGDARVRQRRGQRKHEEL